MLRNIFSVRNHRTVSILLQPIQSQFPAQRLWSTKKTGLKLKTDKSTSFPQNNATNEHNSISKVCLNADIQRVFRCDESKAIKIQESLAELSGNVDLKALSKTAAFLRRIGASLPVIMNNCNILLVPLDLLKQRYERLQRSRWDQVDDFLPLLAVDENEIKTLQLYESHNIRNRIYLFKEYCLIEPHIISHYCTKHLFIFELESSESLKRKLDMLLAVVSPANLLRDLNVLARSEKTIKKRLKYIKECGIDHVLPWMIKCNAKILNRTIQIRQECQPNQNKIREVLASKLDLHFQTAKSIYAKNLFLHQLDPIAVSNSLDELLRIFSPDDIVANISILGNSLEHVKIRVSELITINNATITPKLLKISDKKFKLYLDESKK